MDEVSKQAIETAVSTLLAPFSKVADNVIGVVGGDALATYRERKQRRRMEQYEATASEARQLIEQRGVQPDPETPPERLEEIFEASAENSIPELRALFARLAAAAVDTLRQNNYRREFVEIVKRLEPIDAAVLATFVGQGYWLSEAKKSLHRDDAEIQVAVKNLERLGLVETPLPYSEEMDEDSPENFNARRFSTTDPPRRVTIRRTPSTQITPLGTQFLKVISDS